MNQTATAEVTTNDPDLLGGQPPAPRPTGAHYALLVNNGSPHTFFYKHYADAQQYKKALLKAAAEVGPNMVVGFRVQRVAKFSQKIDLEAF